MTSQAFITIYMNPSIGIYYDFNGFTNPGDATFTGTAEQAHLGIYYSFSNPGQVTRYDFINNRKTTSQRTPGTGEGTLEQNLTIVGKNEIMVMDPENNTYMNSFYKLHKKIPPHTVSYKCVHLEYQTKTSRVIVTSDYWMSNEAPGFGEGLGGLGAVNPGMILLNFNGTILNYGGLVRMESNMSFTNSQIMKPSNATLELVEAQKGLYISPSMFSPPTN
jgi:hypothetical protein